MVVCAAGPFLGWSYPMHQLSEHLLRGQLSLALLLLSSVHASAQVSVPSTFLTRYTYACSVTETENPTTIEDFCTCPEDASKACTVTPADSLTKLKQAGSSKDLQEYARRLFQAWRHRTPEDQGLDGDDYYRLVWQAPGADGKPAASYVVAHNGDVGEIANRLPGMSANTSQQLFDILISQSDEAELRSIYVSTESADPLLAKIPDFIQRLNFIGFAAATRGPLGAAPASLGKTRPETDSRPRTISYALYRVDLPHKHAAIEGKDTIITPVTPRGFGDESAEISKAFALREGRQSICAQQLAAKYALAVGDISSQDVCKLTPLVRGVRGADSAKETRAKEVAACRIALTTALDVALESAVKSKECTGEPHLSSDPVLILDARYRELTGRLGQSIASGDFKLSNSPGARYSLGLMTAVVIGGLKITSARAKVDSLLIAPDPMPSVLTMAIVNIHPVAFDRARVTPSWPERLAFFTGGVLTPDFGITGGGGVAVLRGLGLNAGFAWTFPNTLREGETIGQRPQNQNRPFRLGRARVGFVGLSFVFK